MIELMLKLFQVPGILDRDPAGPSRLLQSGNGVLPGATPMLLSPSAVREWGSPRVIPAVYGMDRAGHPMILESGMVPRFNSSFVAPTKSPFGIYTGVTAVIGDVAYDSAHLYGGKVGALQEYRQNLTGTARVLYKGLQVIDSLGWWADAEPQQQPELVGNVCSPSLHLPCEQTQYFQSVLDELFIWGCAVSVALRKALTWLDRELGCVDHLLYTIRKRTSETIRFFCSVCWESRRWFLIHGARPPRAKVQAILDLFSWACSGSSLAY